MTERKERVILKNIRTFMICQECNREKKRMIFVALAFRPTEYCTQCKKLTLWTPKYHVITYEPIDNDS